MGPQILVLLVGLAVAPTVFGEIYQFGADHIEYVTMFRYEGVMTAEEKMKRVQLIVPKCYALKYVRVLVNNRATKPLVNFDEKRKSVTIEYKDQQPGVTTFTVMVKGRTLWDCYNKNK